MLLFGLIRRTIPDHPGIAFAAALFWMIHPVQTEAVHYVIQRTESMMGLCLLLTLYAVRRAIDAPSATRWKVIAVIACAAGMACKETMVVAPVIVALYLWIFDRRPMREHTALLVTLAATWIPLGILMASSPRGDSVGFDLGITAWTWMLNQAVAISHYLKLIIIPAPLLLDHGVPRDLSFAEVWPYALLVITLLALTIFALVRRHPAGFLGAWWFIILAPTSSFIPIITEVAAERRIYLPLAGIMLLLVALASRLPRRSTKTIAVAATLALTTLTLHRGLQWRNPVLQVAEHTPDNPRAHNNLAFELVNRGRIEEAISHLRLGINANPNHAELHNNLGVLLAFTGDTPAAIPHLQRAVVLRPHWHKARDDLARAQPPRRNRASNASALN